MMLPAVRPMDTYVVVPATDDGMACAMVLGRLAPRPMKIWCVSPFALASFFDYPAYDRIRDKAHLLIAGFNNPGDVAAAIFRKNAAQITWWSHHYWEASNTKDVDAVNVRLRVNPQFATTCAWLVYELGITDRESVVIAETIAMGRQPSENLVPWFHVSLALRKEPPQVENALAPFFGLNNTGQPAAEWVEQGRGIWDSLLESYDQTSHWRFPAARGQKASVLPIPRSMVAYYPSLVQIAWTRHDDAWIALLIDSDDHVIVRLNPRLQAEPMRAARLIDEIFGAPVTRLFDRLTILVDSTGLGAVPTVDALSKNGLRLDFAATDC